MAELEVVDASPWPFVPDQLGLVETYQRLGLGVVGVADGSDRGDRADVQQLVGLAVAGGAARAHCY